MAKLDRTWSSLDSLALWQPEHSTQPNPDLLAPIPVPRRRLVRRSLGALGVAAALAVLIWSATSFRADRPKDPFPPQATHSLRVIPGPERLVLSDGSIAKPRHGSQIEVAFTDTERRVHLFTGELHVSVAKNPLRPFVVDAGGLAVRALGTAFSVRRSTDSIDVLVTEGHVQLEYLQAGTGDPVLVPVNAGEHARIDTTPPLHSPVITSVGTADIDHMLAWQSVRLELEDVPLAAVIAEFNLRNRQQLAIGDPAAGQVRVAGTFRADQVDVFARLLEASFGIRVERPAEGPWMLRKAESPR